MAESLALAEHHLDVVVEELCAVSDILGRRCGDLLVDELVLLQFFEGGHG